MARTVAPKKSGKSTIKVYVKNGHPNLDCFGAYRISFSQGFLTYFFSLEKISSNSQQQNVVDSSWDKLENINLCPLRMKIVKIVIKESVRL